MTLNEDSASYGPLLDQYMNTRIYNVSPVPQITRFLLVEAIISSKTNPNRSNAKVKNKKIMPAILFFIFHFHFNNLFRCTCRSRMIVYTIEKDQIKYFVQN